MFELIIGLEVHIQLNTKNKLFCSCRTINEKNIQEDIQKIGNFDDEPNKFTCPTCLGLPGSLPVINREAVVKAIKFGNAVNGTIQNDSIFERKNYFYPDLPMSYQISQLQRPIIIGGQIVVKDKNGNDKTITLDRAHLESDAGKSIHKGDHSLIDLNRTGTPLLEIVTNPDFRSSVEVISYLKNLHELVRHLDICDGNMEKGNFRCDVNVSIRPKGDTKLYTRCEIKNINSFKFIEKAIAYEYQRHVEAWEDGLYEKEIFQETRLFNADKGITDSMRGKEEAMDYRYFPDPDLRPVHIDEDMFKRGEINIELPKNKRIRFQKDFSLKENEIDLLLSDIELCNLFEYFSESQFKLNTIVTWLIIEYPLRLKLEEYQNSKTKITLSDLGDLMNLIEENLINKQGGQKVLDYIVLERTDINETIKDIANKLNLIQNNNTDELLQIIKEVLEEQKESVQEYKNGKVKLLGSFVGQVMKKTGGKANPKLTNELILKEIEGK